MRTKGNAENNYFVLDNQKKFIGLNHSTAQIIEVNFKNNEPSKVVWQNRLQGNLVPIGQVKKESLKLKGFKWLENQKPKTKFDILSPKN